jgi:hypothetical protein
MRPVTSSPDVRQKEGNVSLLPPNTEYCCMATGKTINELLLHLIDLT